MAGKTIRKVELRRPDLRFPLPADFAGRLEGQRVGLVGRRAKYLLIGLANGDTVIAHLGMSGSFRIIEAAAEDAPGLFHAPRGKDPAHDHVVLGLNGATIIYNDPRRFGFMTIAETTGLDAHPLLKDIGVEPLSAAFTAERLASLFAKVKAPLKSALLDQKRVAGLGNIYVCEALHRARLSPMAAASSLADRSGRPNARAGTLVKAVNATLKAAIEAGGSSLRDHRLTDGSLGYFQHRFAVYDREGAPCLRRGCAGTVKRIVQGGRATFFCADCQRG